MCRPQASESGCCNPLVDKRPYDRQISSPAVHTPAPLARVFGLAKSTEVRPKALPTRPRRPPDEEKILESVFWVYFDSIHSPARPRLKPSIHPAKRLFVMVSAVLLLAIMMIDLDCDPDNSRIALELIWPSIPLLFSARPSVGCRTKPTREPQGLWGTDGLSRVALEMGNGKCDNSICLLVDRKIDCCCLSMAPWNAHIWPGSWSNVDSNENKQVAMKSFQRAASSRLAVLSPG